jgi:bifunctional DNA-binding transcriptional regulator/antitoxin component of YhaV-PrlF toxin-antitoxin module
MATTRKIVKSTRNGQITIPMEFRKQLGSEGEALWQVTLEDRALKVVPVRAVERSGDPDWYERLYEHFAPARAEALARGYTEDEINGWIDEAVAAVRPKRRG